MNKGQRKTLELSLYELDRFAEYLNLAGYETEQIAVRYEFENSPMNKVVANALRLAMSFLPKIFMKLAYHKAYQQKNIISIKFTASEITALRCVVGILQVENPDINNTNEVRQLMMHIQY